MEILTNKQYREYDYISRYSGCPSYYHILDNKYITATAKWLDDETIYTEYVVQMNDSYDKLALKFYNNPTYYWIICSFNRVLDPFEMPLPGTRLKIPSISNIKFIDK